MSVFLAATAAEPSVVMVGHDAFGLAAITAELARRCSQVVVRDPTPDQPSHALVIGRKTNSIRTQLGRGAVWVIRPPGIPTEG